MTYMYPEARDSLGDQRRTMVVYIKPCMGLSGRLRLAGPSFRLLVESQNEILVEKGIAIRAIPWLGVFSTKFEVGDEYAIVIRSRFDNLFLITVAFITFYNTANIEVLSLEMLVASLTLSLVAYLAESVFLSVLRIPSRGLVRDLT